MAIDVSYRDTFTTSAEDLARTNRNFIINEGVAFDGLKVTQSLTPAMTVAVATGTGYFYGSGTNANVMYEFYSDANETVTIGTAGVQARIDIICLKVDASTGVASIVAVAGTPSGSPAVPATPASHYKLAEVAVGISVTTITNANITDTRRSVFVAPTGARNQGLINGKIVPTVASNNLTVAIKTLTDTDPSATNPVGIWIGNNLRWITSSLSIAANAGTNWFASGSAELATREIDYFAYIGYNATDGITLGYARIPYAKLYSDFSATTTNEKYARISTITNAASGDNYINIGRFAATLSATASFNWSVPSFTNANLIQEPVYETRYLSYTPTLSGSSGSIGTFTANPYIGQYKISNNKVHLLNQIKCTNVGSWSGDVRVRLPINPNTNGPDQNPLAGYVAANGANPATASRGFASYINGLGLYYFLTGVDTAGLAWGTFVVNDHIRINGHYYI
jgi:hypothetical protein